MDSILLVFCFLSMAVLVLAWAMLPHRAAGVEPVRGYHIADASAEPALNVQAA